MERITDYFSLFLSVIKQDTWVRSEDISFREIGEKEGYVRGSLCLHGGYELHIAEYVIITDGNPISTKYRYQLLFPEGKFAVRWDNAPHYKEISSFPHHKHCRDGHAVSSSARNIFDILHSLDSEIDDKMKCE